MHLPAAGVTRPSACHVLGVNPGTADRAIATPGAAEFATLETLDVAPVPGNMSLVPLAATDFAMQADENMLARQIGLELILGQVTTAVRIAFVCWPFSPQAKPAVLCAVVCVVTPVVGA